MAYEKIETCSVRVKAQLELKNKNCVVFNCGFSGAAGKCLLPLVGHDYFLWNNFLNYHLPVTLPLHTKSLK